MKSKNLRFDKFNHLQLSKLSSTFDLSFSRQEILSNKIIGLDGIKRKLLVAEKNNELGYPYIIELSRVTTITIRKIYHSIKAGELKIRRLEEFLESILLQFEFGNEKNTIVLPFYEGKINKLHDLPRLERRARWWQMILSKIVTTQNIGPAREKRQLRLAD